jgi:hypothetical protein
MTFLLDRRPNTWYSIRKEEIMGREEAVFKHRLTNGEVRKDGDDTVFVRTYSAHPSNAITQAERDAQVPWSVGDGLLNMGLIPILCFMLALWAMRHKDAWTFVGAAGGGIALVAAAFIKYGDKAWGGLIGNTFCVGAIVAVIGILLITARFLNPFRKG